MLGRLVSRVKPVWGILGKISPEDSPGISGWEFEQAGFRS